MPKFNGLGRALLEYLEGCALDSYQDAGGMWTIGYGHTGGVQAGQTITQAQAEALLAQDLDAVVRTVTPLVPPDIGDDKFSALVIFAFNVGLADFRTSTLLNCVRKLRYVDAANEFQRWVHVKGVVDSTLVRRRKIERALFLLE